MIRLQKYLADSGVASRRQAEAFITEGRVRVNNKAAFLGQSVDPDTDRVTFDGDVVRPARVRLYLAMNKPRETLSSSSDARGRRTVFQLLPELPVRMHTIGRLDFQSEGLLLFTNDGDMTRGLTRPGSLVQRVYEVKIQGKVPDWAILRVTKGVRLDDGMAKAAVCERLRVARTNEWLTVILTEGRYREVRRMFSTLGFNVLKLKRVRFGPINLGKLPLGAVRELSKAEVDAMRDSAGMTEEE